MRTAFQAHFNSYEHRMRVYRMSNGLRSVLGPLAGQTMRHHTRSSTANRPIEGPGMLFLNAGRQGMSLPTHENRRSESGTTHELCVLTMEAAMTAKLKASLLVSDPKRQGAEKEGDLFRHPGRRD